MMGGIKVFIITLFTTASAVTLIDSFVPDGTGVKKYLKYLTSLIIILILLSPLKGLVGMIPTLIENDTFVYDSIEAMSKVNSIIAMHIESAVCQKFDIEDENAAAEFENGTIVLKVKQRIGLLESDIIRFVELNFGTTAEVIFYE